MFATRYLDLFHHFYDLDGKAVYLLVMKVLCSPPPRTLFPPSWTLPPRWQSAAFAFGYAHWLVALVGAR